MEEAPQEDLQPALEGLEVVAALEGEGGQIQDSPRAGSAAHEVEEEEVVQLVGADGLFGELGDLPVGVGRQQLG